MFYYVVAVPAATVDKCKGNALCDTYGDRPITGLATGGEACHAAAPGQYAGNCARGWVSADVLDMFSNGMDKRAVAAALLPVVGTVSRVSAPLASATPAKKPWSPQPGDSSTS